MADIYDISSIPARFAAEVTRGADKLAAQRAELQNRRAAISTLPGVTTYPAGTFTGTIRGRDSVTDALNSAWGRACRASLHRTNSADLRAHMGVVVMLGLMEGVGM